MDRNDRRPDATAAEQTAAAGVAHHQHARLKEAEDFYRRTLTLDPTHLRTLYHLGIVGLQTGRPDLAADMIGQALAQDGSNPEWHYHLALAEQMRGRLDDAATHYAEALRLNPAYAEAHTNLGNVLTQQGKLDEAATHYREVLRLRPNSHETHYNLANVLIRQDRHADAIVHFRQALALQPKFAEAHHNLGLALMAAGSVAEARLSFQQAVTIRGDFAPAYRSLVRALLAEQNAEQALAPAMLALQLDEQPEARTLFVDVLQALRSMPDLPGIRELVARAFDERWCRPTLLTGAVYLLAAQNDAVRLALERAREPDSAALDDAAYAALGRDVLLRRLLQSTRLTGVAMERLLTAARTRGLAAAERESLDGELIAFHAALAEQCFINNYVYAMPPDELERAETLKAALESALSAGGPLPEARLVAVAAYLPLHALRGADALPRQQWRDAVRSLIDRQVREPLEERTLAAGIPALTPIGEGVSQAVRAQYEESPYPVWIAAPPPSRTVTLDADLKAKFPHAPIQPRDTAGRTDILIAGCGTGQAMELVQNYDNVSALAVDLSLTSLGYAKRRTIELGLRNIEYGQADILHLGSLGRSFDAIVSTGVLHHMAEPEAGLRVLVSLLKPRGFMLLGLYSETARQDVVALQRQAAERGFAANAADIRRFRQEIMALGESDPSAAIAGAADFFSIGECRDLLFHVQEHRYTLPQIEAMLAQHGLEFLGFELPAAVRRQYAAQNPDDAAMTDLDGWHRFETEHPRTFVGMYQFWAQKRD